MVVLAGIESASDERLPLILDPCCGSGGFLIDALAHMWSAVDANPSLSDKKKKQLKNEIAQSNIMGIDVGQNPLIARIARINMYLHGDGGSRIYQADSLDKAFTVPTRFDAERKRELKELGEIVSDDGFCDIILTNPLFQRYINRSTHRKSEFLTSMRLVRSFIKAESKQGLL